MDKDTLDQLIKCPKCFGTLISTRESNICNDCNTVYYNNHNGQPKFIEESLYDDNEDYEHILSVSKYWDAGWRKRNEEEHVSFLNLNTKEIHDNAKKQKKEQKL